MLRLRHHRSDTSVFPLQHKPEPQRDPTYKKIAQKINALTAEIERCHNRINCGACDFARQEINILRNVL